MPERRDPASRPTLRERLRARRSTASDLEDADDETTAPEPEPSDESRSRRQPRAPSAPVRVCAITFCRDEAAMLPLWIQYYGRELGVENLYVIDDNSSDGSTDDLPCDVLRIPPIREGGFEPVRMGMLSHLAETLLELYDAVVFSDVDEFIVPDPDRYESLRSYIEARTPDRIDAVAPLGLNVVHHVGAEPGLDLTQPLLGQRQLAKFLPLMCKPAIKWSPASWAMASHGLRTPYQVDRALWMFHMKFADRSHLQQSADHRRRMVELDGRARTTTWRQGGDVLVSLLEQITEGIDPAEPRDFVPPRGRELSRLVIESPDGVWRARRGGQREQMEHRPLVRIPERFHGRV